MTPALIIFMAWVIFGGSHLWLSASNLRERMPANSGPNAFTVLFSAITCITMLCLIGATVLYGDKGIAGPNLGQYFWGRWALGGLGATGCLLAIAGLLNYPKSPMAVLATRQRQNSQNHKALQPPSSVERVSRHPFFAGLAALMLAHTLLATTLAGAVYFGGFVLIAVIGIPLQDRKLERRWRETYSEFLDRTRAIPFKRATVPTVTPMQWGIWILAVIITTTVFGLMHPFWSSWNGAPFAIFILMFGLSGVASAIFLSIKKNNKL